MRPRPSYHRALRATPGLASPASCLQPAPTRPLALALDPSGAEKTGPQPRGGDPGASRTPPQPRSGNSAVTAVARSPPRVNTHTHPRLSRRARQGPGNPDSTSSVLHPGPGTPPPPPPRPPRAQEALWSPRKLPQAPGARDLGPLPGQPQDPPRQPAPQAHQHTPAHCLGPPARGRNPPGTRVRITKQLRQGRRRRLRAATPANCGGRALGARGTAGNRECARRLRCLPGEGGGPGGTAGLGVQSEGVGSFAELRSRCYPPRAGARPGKARVCPQAPAPTRGKINPHALPGDSPSSPGLCSLRLCVPSQAGETQGRCPPAPARPAAPPQQLQQWRPRQGVRTELGPWAEGPRSGATGSSGD